MVFAWRTFLALAEELGNRADEAALRTATSRAYYAVVGTAYDALPVAERATTTPGNYHERTWHLYAMSSTFRCRQIGNAGYRLRGRRRASDYRADLVVVQSDVRVTLDDAKDLIALIDRHGYRP